MHLLSLPEELLLPIILETMWATTTSPTNPPDLLMHERRLTNHPSMERKKRVFIGHICSRLRRIAQPLLRPAQLWYEPDERVKLDKSRQPVVVDAPTSLMEPTIKAIAFGRGQAVWQPQLASSAVERLVDLSLSYTAGGCVDYSDDVLHSIGSCKQLQHLAIHLLRGSASGMARLFDDIASIPTLQSLAIGVVIMNTDPDQPLQLGLGQTWSAPLARLEVIWCQKVTVGRFLELMGKVAATIQVAIFHHSEDRTYSTFDLTTAVVASFPQFWRLDIGFGAGAHPRYRHLYATRDSTPAGRQQFAQGTPIVIWKAAPRLEYFECSEQIVVKTQKELDEVGELRKREGMKRLRITLETWEGDKGAGWTTDKIQELIVG